MKAATPVTSIRCVRGDDEGIVCRKLRSVAPHRPGIFACNVGAFSSRNRFLASVFSTSLPIVADLRERISQAGCGGAEEAASGKIIVSKFSKDPPGGH